MSKKILFVTYGGGHVNMVIPTVKCLEKRGAWEITVMGLTSARKILTKQGIQSIGFTDLITDSDQSILRLGEKLARLHYQPDVGVSYDESVAYLGLSYSDLITRKGEEQAEKELALKGRRAFLPLEPMERLIKKILPDIVVATNSPRSEEAAIRVAQKHGIPALCMVDMLGTDWPDSAILQNDFATKIAVFSSHIKEHLIVRGRNPETIVITGNPAFDKLADNFYAIEAKKFKKPEWENKKLILWASQIVPEKNLNNEILKKLTEISLKNKDWQFLYRPHPNEIPLMLPNEIEICPQNIETAAALHAVDLVLVISTTVGLEAALLGKNIVQIMLSEFSCLAPYENMGISLPIFKLDNLEEAIKQLTTKSPESANIAKARLQLPKVGDASKNMCELIEELAR